jgi:hypothetical protein
MLYFGDRINPIKNIDENVLDQIFKLIIDSFDKSWLELHDENPIQRLWNRKDYLSTIELFSLGYAIKKLGQIDKKWLKHKVKLIKEKDENNIKGALFELLGLSLLDQDNGKILLSKRNQKGYDAIFKFNDGYAIRLSLKNYNISSRNRDFLKKSEQFEDLLKKVLKEKEIDYVQMTIVSPNSYPTNNNWELLFEQLPTLLDSFIKYRSSPPFSEKEIWYVIINNIISDGISLNEKFQSYELLIFSKYHENEEKNLFSNLDKACNNLVNFSILEDDKTLNFLYIHLPFNSSFLNCASWSETYLKENPQKPISGILLYQPYYGLDPITKEQHLYHCFSFVLNEKTKKLQTSRNINLLPRKIPFGIPTSNPCDIVVSTNSDHFHLQNYYFYQSGHYYINPKVKENGEIFGTASKIAPGITSHTVFKSSQNEYYKIVSGHFSPDDRLLIL